MLNCQGIDNEIGRVKDRSRQVTDSLSNPKELPKFPYLKLEALTLLRPNGLVLINPRPIHLSRE